MSKIYKKQIFCFNVDECLKTRNRMKMRKLLLSFMLFLQMVCLKISNANAQVYDLYVFKENNLWGLRNNDKGVVVPPRFKSDEIPDFIKDNYYPVLKVFQKGKFTLMDTSGRVIFPTQFEEMKAEKLQGISFLKTNDKWGVYNLESLKEFCPPIFDEIFVSSYRHYNFYDDLYQVQFPFYFVVNVGGSYNGYRDWVEGKWGVLKVYKDTSELVLPLIYDEVFDNGNLFSVKKDNKYGMFDEDGKIILPLEYTHMIRYDKFYMYLVNIGEGKKVYNSGWADDYHYAGDKWGIVDFEGKEIVPLEYDYIRPKPTLEILNDYGDELIKVGKDNKYGLITFKGELLIPVEYDEIDDNIYSYNDFMDILPYDRENGFVIVRKGKYWGVINKENKVVLPLQFDEIISLGNDYKAIKDNQEFYYDKDGKSIQP